MDTEGAAEPLALPAKANPARPWRLLGLAAIAGLLIEALVHRQPAGAGFAVAAGVAVLAIEVGLRPEARSLRGGSLAVALSLLFFATMVAIRSGAVLTVFNISATLALLFLVVRVAAGPALSSLGLFDYLSTLLGGALAALLQPLGHAGEMIRQRAVLTQSRQPFHVLGGVALAVPPFLVFGSLFAAADAVYDDSLRRLFDIDWRDLLARLVLSAVVAWGVLGLLREMLGPWFRGDRVRGWTGRDVFPLGRVEAITLLSLINVLFLTFIGVQMTYLFGGADTLSRIGMSYSEYARRGFFELVAVAALVTGLVWTLDGLAKPVADASARPIDALHGLLLAQTLVIVASAAQRMRLYVASYGLTELRFYTMVFMLWIAGLMIWMAMTALRGRRGRFPIGALATGIAIMAGVNLLNPNALIARTNLERETTGEVRPLDIDYLIDGLTEDAVPQILDDIGKLPEGESRRDLASALLREKTRLDQEEASADWRGFSWGRRRAQAALTEAGGWIEQMAHE